MNAILELQELPVDEIDGEGELALMSTSSNHCTGLTIN
ncbi:class III lanthipeptide [Streptomyces sp. NPDC006632]